MRLPSTLVGVVALVTVNLLAGALFAWLATLLWRILWWWINHKI